MADPEIDLVGSARLAENLAVFKTRVAEAQRKGLCIICEKPASWYSEAGKREYAISGTCESCFDAMFAEDEETE